MDVVEVNPILDRENATAQLAVELVASALGGTHSLGLQEGIDRRGGLVECVPEDAVPARGRPRA
jgi:hypothetical protein